MALGCASKAINYAAPERPEEDLLESSLVVKKPVIALNMQYLGQLKDL